MATARLQTVAALVVDDIVGDRTVIYAAEERHVLLTSEKTRAFIDNITGKKDRMIEGEVVKKDDDDG